MNKIIFKVIIATLLLVSCGSSNENDKKSLEEENRINARKLRLLKFEKITQDYKIAYDWDTLNLDFTIEHDTILKSKHQLIKNIDILDVQKNDTLYSVIIQCDSYPIYIFTLTTTDHNIIEIIINNKDIINYKFAMIVSIKKIKKGLFQISSEINDDGFAHPELEPSDYYFGEGELINLIKVD
ncbi:MAG: hypothetical protein H6570_09935 [Lewinellaceae bacterium]|nr:hypothetical protein [Lewinellaceae bacterium]